MTSLGGLSTAPLPTAHRTGGPLRLSTRRNHTWSGAEQSRAERPASSSIRGAVEREGPGQGRRLGRSISRKLSYKKILKDVLGN